MKSKKKIKRIMKKQKKGDKKRKLKMKKIIMIKGLIYLIDIKIN